MWCEHHLFWWKVAQKPVNSKCWIHFNGLNTLCFQAKLLCVRGSFGKTWKITHFYHQWLSGLLILCSKIFLYYIQHVFVALINYVCLQLLIIHLTLIKIWLPKGNNLHYCQTQAHLRFFHGICLIYNWSNQSGKNSSIQSAKMARKEHKMVCSMKPCRMAYPMLEQHSRLNSSSISQFVRLKAWALIKVYGGKV